MIVFAIAVVQLGCVLIQIKRSLGIDFQMKKLSLDFPQYKEIYQQLLLKGISTYSMKEVIFSLSNNSQLFLHKVLGAYQRYYVKIITFYLFAILCRFALQGFDSYHLSRTDQQLDRVLVFISFLLSSAGFYLGYKFRPMHWYYNKNIEIAGMQYLKSRLLEECEGNFPWYQKWNKLDSQELLNGISMQEDKKMLLNSYLNFCEQECMRKLEIYKHSLQIKEFFCGVLPCLILTIVPTIVTLLSVH